MEIGLFIEHILVREKKIRLLCWRVDVGEYDPRQHSIPEMN